MPTAPGAVWQLTEIRDLLTVRGRSGKQKKPEIDGLENERSRHSERLVGRPDMFLMRTHRERSIKHSFGMIFRG